MLGPCGGRESAVGATCCSLLGEVSRETRWPVPHRDATLMVTLSPGWLGEQRGLEHCRDVGIISRGRLVPSHWAPTTHLTHSELTPAPGPQTGGSSREGPGLGPRGRLWPPGVHQCPLGALERQTGQLLGSGGECRPWAAAERPHMWACAYVCEHAMCMCTCMC